MKKIFTTISIIFFTLVSLQLFAQEEIYEIANGGPEGIYINLGIDLPSKMNTEQNLSAYRIERKLIDTDEWKNIADYSTPNSQEEFKERLNSFESILSSDFMLSDKTISSLWNKIERTHRLDSLGFWSNYLIVRLAAGAVYYDDTAERDQKYQYKISSVNDQGNPTNSFLSNFVSFPGIAELASLEFVNPSVYENALQLQFLTSEGNQPSIIFVYRKELRDSEYQKINPSIVTSRFEDRLQLTILDTTITKDRVYQYYLVPLDYYGNPGKATKEKLVASYNFQQVPLPQNIDAMSSDSLGGINLTWQAIENEVVKSVKIYRSEIFDSSFISIAEIPSGQSSYTDINIEPMKKYFYFLQLVGPLNEVSSPSAKVFGMYESLEPPLPPYGLRSEQVDSGVELTWNKNDDNIKGYYVYRKDPANQKFSQISDLLLSNDSLIAFTDTSLLNGQYSYAYYVRSENISHILSEPSDTAYIVPSQSLKPMAPLNINVIEENNTAKVFWNNMTKVDNTIAAFNVYRKDNGGEYKKLNSEPMSIEENFFVDTTVNIGDNNSYAVQSVDLFDNTSDLSNPISFKIDFPIPVAPGPPYTVSDVDGIRISWDEVINEDIVKYNIYRYQRGNESKILGSVKSQDELSFTDDSAEFGELYFYQITSVNKYGKESKPSSETGIRR